jgi:hypothetical protein
MSIHVDVERELESHGDDSESSSEKILSSDSEKLLGGEKDGDDDICSGNIIGAEDLAISGNVINELPEEEEEVCSVLIITHFNQIFIF